MKTLWAGKPLLGLTMLVLSSSASVFGQAPTLGPGSASPASGGGQTTFTISATGVSASLASVQMLIGWGVSGSNSCYLDYSPPTNSLYLSLDQSGWTPAGMPGSGAPLSNGQCSVNLVATTVTNVGNTVTIKPVITFNSSFVGTMGVYGYASDTAGNAVGFQQLFTYTTFTANSQAPSGVVAPNTGTGMSQVFTITSSDINGWKYIPYETLLIGPNDGTLAHSCAVLAYSSYGGCKFNCVNGHRRDHNKETRWQSTLNSLTSYWRTTRSPKTS